MNVLVMNKSNPYCWALMPQLIEKIKAFAEEHTNRKDDPTAARYEAAFGLGANEMFAVAILPDDSCHLAGHVVAGIESYLGENVCMVYQFEKYEGSDEDWREVNKSIQAVLDTWCQSIGLKEIMAMAQTKSRGRLFRQFGYAEGPVLLRRRFE